jgi:hypothetical protein
VSVFIELVTDAFEATFKQQASTLQSARGGSRAGKSDVRRPTNGIEIKYDTYAYLKVVRSNGQEIPVMDSSFRDGLAHGGYTNFILQSVQEQRMEKHQIVETFGDNYVFFFGESPRFLDCTAMLVSTNDFNWRAEWWENYENHWRGTKLVEQGARCYMAWDDIVVEGYMIQAAASETSEQPYTVQIQFRFFVTHYQNVNTQHVEQYPTRQSVSLAPSAESTNADAIGALQSGANGQSVLGKQLSQGGYGVGPLMQNSPMATQSGPGSYSFGSPAGSISALSMSAASLGLNVASLGGALTSGGLGAYSTISQSIRQLPPSAVADPSLWTALSGIGLAPTTAAQPDPTRGLIADNTSEYVSGSGQVADPLSAINDAVAHSQELPYGLPYGVVNTLGSMGIDADSPTVMRDMGLSPNFSAAYVASVSAAVRASSSTGYPTNAGVGANVSFGGSSGKNVSFSPQSNASYGVSAGAGIGISALAGYYANAGASQSTLSASPYYQYKSPLGAIYGNNAAQTNAYNANAYQYVEGLGDPTYGYGSPYGGVGYGRAGFGDFGGKGFGTGNSGGDPGYRDPNTVVASGQIAQARPQYDMTALTPGPTFGATAYGGASINVGGVSTGFSMTALEGAFDDWVTEAAQAEEPLYGQSAVGPGSADSYQPDIGYAAQQLQSRYPVSVPYVGTPQAVIAATAPITSFGFV